MKHEHFVEHCQMVPDIVPAIATDDELSHAQQLRETARQPQELVVAIDEVQTLLLRRPGNEVLLVTLLELMERKGDDPGMPENWDALANVFPQNETCFRMRVRWMRRQNRVPDGMALIDTRYPLRNARSAEAVGYFIGLQELKLTDETDAFFQHLPDELMQDRMVQLAYLRALLNQERYAEAAEIAKTVAEDKNRTESENVFVQKALHFGAIYEELKASGAQSVPAYLVQAFTQRVLREDMTDQVGKLALFTPQLSAGGAERQFVRVAAALQRAAHTEQTTETRRIDGPVKLSVADANPDTGKDFFLPYLRDAGIEVSVLGDLVEPEVKNPFADLGTMGDVYYLLPKSIRKNVRRLAAIYRQDGTQTAYIWQDGGMRVAALAALAAGVPRIILCFRSTPMNIRKDFVRPFFEGYVQSLIRVPGVIVACNSHIMAEKYADWLGIDTADIAVVLNAATSHPVDGHAEDNTLWNDICAASPDCTKTVLGVFRLHPVKRPDLWVSVAEKFLAQDQNTRFVIIGTGDEYDKVRSLIDERGLNDRVFLAGARKAVGFWLEKADVVLHCARHEGLPNAILEAQLAGCPIITTPAGGTAEAFLPGESGICLSQVEPFPVDEALEALTTLLSDHQMRADMGQAGRAFVEKNFSMEASLAKTLDLLCSPIGEGQ